MNIFKGRSERQAAEGEHSAYMGHAWIEFEGVMADSCARTCDLVWEEWLEIGDRWS